MKSAITALLLIAAYMCVSNADYEDALAYEQYKCATWPSVYQCGERVAGTVERSQ